MWEERHAHAAEDANFASPSQQRRTCLCAESERERSMIAFRVRMVFFFFLTGKHTFVVEGGERVQNCGLDQGDVLRGFPGSTYTHFRAWCSRSAV